MPLTGPVWHWKTTQLYRSAQAIRNDASMVLDGAMNGAAFQADVHRVLIPTLASGDIIIMDNPPAHKAEGACHAIDAGCRLLYLPPYSLEVSPIKTAFAKARPSCAPKAERTIDGLWKPSAT